MSKKYLAADLGEDIMTTCDIQCSKPNCKESASLHCIDEYGAADVFFENGWRRTENYCYCPKCAKKYLKS